MNHLQFPPLERHPRDGWSFSPISLRRLTQTAKYLNLFEEVQDLKQPILLMLTKTNTQREHLLLAPQSYPEQSIRLKSDQKRWLKIYHGSRNTVRYVVSSGITNAEDIITIRHIQNPRKSCFLIPDRKKIQKYIECFREQLKSLANHLLKAPMAIPFGLALDMATNFPPVTPPGTETTATAIAVFDVYCMTRFKIHQLLSAMTRKEFEFIEDSSLKYVEQEALQGKRYKALLALDAADGIGDYNGINGMFTPQNVLLATKFLRED